MTQWAEHDTVLSNAMNVRGTAASKKWNCVLPFAICVDLAADFTVRRSCLLSLMSVRKRIAGKLFGCKKGIKSVARILWRLAM